MSDPSTKRRRLNGPPSPGGETSPGYASSDNDQDSKVASTQAKKQNPQNSTKSANRFAEVGKATGLSKSSLFKLQTDELLAGLRPDYDKLISTVQDNLRRIRDILQQVPERESKRADVAAKELRDKDRIT
ncbi:hypothetical protein F66182_17968, partial [Fusarium sp. NRRL 66182]